MTMTRIVPRVVAIGGAFAVAAAVSGCEPTGGSSGAGTSAAPGITTSSAASSPSTSAPSSPSSASSSSSDASSGATSSSTSDPAGENATTVTGERSRMHFDVPQGWKVFTRADLKNPTKLDEVAKLTDSSVADLKKALATDGVDDLLLGPRLQNGGTQNISMGPSSIPKSEGIPDEPAARLKALKQGVDFVKFSYVNTSAGRAAAVETRDTTPGKQPLTQIDFLVPGPNDTLDELFVTAGDSATANSILQGIEKSFSLEH